MYKELNTTIFSINTPNNSQVIWRYMDFWKFLDIIDNSRLFLSQVASLEDNYEGRISNQRAIEGNLSLKNIDAFLHKTYRFNNYINCWSTESFETYPMWKIYSDYRTAILIKSTIGNLIKSISDEEKENYIGLVNYVDSNEDTHYYTGNIFQYFFEKRKYYAYEKEVRILTTINTNNEKEFSSLPTGIYIKTNPKILITEIKLAPLATESFKNLIELKLSNIGLNIPVQFSEI